MSPKDAALVSAAASTVNEFADDGSFMSKILVKQNEDAGGPVGSYSNQEENVESHVDMLFKVFLREARRMKMLIGILLNLQADHEYDFEDGPRSKSHKKGRDSGHKVSEKNDLAKRILTQQERCHFIFENPNRPKHICCCLSGSLLCQLDSAARNVDNNVGEEIRNFKKCLLMMFSKQEKDLVFLETVISLSKQRRHCLIECISKQAPLYFKKQIVESKRGQSDEYITAGRNHNEKPLMKLKMSGVSQHNTKKLTDTSEKGLRGSIPKNFPYFHVEFGLNRGFVHVIDDKKTCNDARGMEYRWRHKNWQLQILEIGNYFSGK
ncbi:hypothetical protein POTOM_041211 [Populus tomentosa]|uniref:Uncharacterized protein n=1 Tax=Populus tomentosa TaxID=118781 RepID=A0A8X8CID3_POPTO|nr:hypothetical protein POTOM_041211 [Populus tomentosa]